MEVVRKGYLRPEQTAKGSGSQPTRRGREKKGASFSRHEARYTSACPWPRTGEEEGKARMPDAMQRPRRGQGSRSRARKGAESRAEPEQQGQRPTATKRQGMKGREGGGTRISEFPDTQGDLGKQAHQVGGILLGSLSALGPPLLPGGRKQS